MTREVHVRRRAWADLALAASSIIRTVDAASARRWRLRIERSIAELAEDADIWPEADEAGELKIDLR
ncbi:MAG TPA: hypothetical protein VN641_08025 [Urbifossiella sp.]|jgi:plasmid stabilization system protein ParE|nr:hypothetical protein [Urbifossiella sp.]